MRTPQRTPQRTFQLTTAAAAILCATLLASAQFVVAQSLYRYVDANGKVHYTDRPPAETAGRAKDKLSKQGIVIQHVPAAKTEAERAAAEEARKKKADDDLIVRNEQRRIQAIMSAYSSEKEIEDARLGALNPVLEVIGQTEKALLNLHNRADKLKPEIEALGGKPMPAKLHRATKNIEVETRAMERLLEAKRSEEKSINARFAVDLRRYTEGTQAIAERKANRAARVPGSISARAQ